MNDNARPSAPVVGAEGTPVAGDEVVRVTCASCGLPGHRYGRNEGPKRYDPMACINSLRGEVERLQALVNEHHNVAPWLKGSAAQHRVGLHLWGTLCAVCNPPTGVEGPS